MGRPTRAWWLIRLEFALAIVGVMLLWPALDLVSARIYIDEPVRWFGLNPLPLLGAGGIAGLVVGFIWMIRIARGPRDEPPAWRYRDH